MNYRTILWIAHLALYVAFGLALLWADVTITDKPWQGITLIALFLSNAIISAIREHV